MELLGLTAAQIRAGGAYWTAREIAQQPEVWPEVERRVTADAQLAGFLAPLLAQLERRDTFGAVARTREMHHQRRRARRQ